MVSQVPRKTESTDYEANENSEDIFYLQILFVLFWDFCLFCFLFAYLDLSIFCQ